MTNNNDNNDGNISLSNNENANNKMENNENNTMIIIVKNGRILKINNIVKSVCFHVMHMSTPP